MKNLKVILTVLVFCHSFQFLHAQRITVKGTVTDKFSEPVPVANVQVKGT